MKKLIFILILFITFQTAITANQSVPKKFTILFTGETHGMIYPCDCKIEPDGGVSRRSTVIKKIRKKNTVFLLDAGGFFAGTKYDVYTEGEIKDKARTLTMIQAMRLMNYDAVALGDDEFTWGFDFAKNHLIHKLPTLSCNLFYLDKKNITASYRIINRNGINLGIIGVTTPELLENKPELTNTIKIEDPIKSVENIVKIIRSNVDYVVILSHLGEDLNVELAKKIKNIDLIINSHKKTSVGMFANIDDTLVVQFDFQGKKIGRIDVHIENQTHKPSSSFKEIRISQEIEDDNEIKELLIKHEKQTKELGSSIKSKDTNVIVKILYSSTSIYPDYYQVMNYLNPLLPGLKADFIPINSDTGKNLAELHKIDSIPSFIFNKEIEQTRNFSTVSAYLKKTNDEYLLNTENIKFSELFIQQEKIENQIDIFISPFAPQSYLIIDAFNKIHERFPKIKLEIHYIIYQNSSENFSSKRGQMELEEIQRQLAIKKYAPEKIMEYLQIRSKSLTSSYWEEPIKAVNMDPQIIKTLSQSEDIKSLMIEDAKKVKTYRINSEVAVISNNQERIPLINPKQLNELVEKIINKL